MSPRVKQYIESHFGVVMAISFVLGLILPGLDCAPDHTVTLIIAVMMFLSCFKVQGSQLRRISFKKSLWFYSMRFVLFPLVLLFAAQALVPQHASAVYLLALMPVGVASPAITGLIGGNIALALGLVTATSLVSPFIVPLLISSFSQKTISINTWGVFLTLSTIVFTPLLIHIPFRKHKATTAWIEKNNNLVSVLLIGAMTVIVIAKRRDIIFSDPVLVAELLSVLSVEYLLFYLASWFIMPKKTTSDSLTFAICSGVNNNGLGMSVALLYFPPIAALYLLLSEIPWVLGIVVFKRFCTKGGS